MFLAVHRALQQFCWCSCQCFSERGDSLEAVCPPLSLPFFSLFICVMGAFFTPSSWGLMAGLPGFASHGSSLHLGAGCQQWKHLDVSGTQPPLCEAFVNRRNINTLVNINQLVNGLALVSALDTWIDSSGFEPWLTQFCCVLGWDMHGSYNSSLHLGYIYICNHVYECWEV